MTVQPTNIEYKVLKGDSLVTKTDLNGVITYANSDFERASGYSIDELIGQSHGIVHHPDMPTEVFADLWQTLKAGRTWIGVLKNLRKDGGYFWALINITPNYENGKLIGYLASRSMATSIEINFFEQAYKRFKSGNAGKLKIKNGFLFSDNFKNRFKNIGNTSIKKRIIAMVGLVLMVILGISSVGLFTLSQDDKHLHTVFKDRVEVLANISTVQKLITENYILITTSNQKSPSEIESVITQIEKNKAGIKTILSSYIASNLIPEEKLLLTQLIQDKHAYLDNGLNPAIDALQKRNLVALESLIYDKITLLYLPIKNDIYELTQLQVRETQKIHDEMDTAFKKATLIIISLAVIVFFVFLLISIRLYLGIVPSLNKMATLMRHGDYQHTKAEQFVATEIRNILDAFKTSQIRNSFELSELKRVTDNNLRVQIGLDSVSTGVMVADQNRNIIYFNRAAENLLRKAESDIRKELPNFNVSKLVGTNIDLFHKNPEHQKKLLGDLKQQISAKINIGGRSLVVIANPVINERGDHLGSAAEWHDRTHEVLIENEVADIMDGIGRGDFSKRIDEAGKENFVLQMSQGINRLVKACSESLNETASVLNSLSRGDLTQTITGNYEGTFEQLKNDVNSTVESLKNIVEQIQDSTAYISTGSKEIATGNNDLSNRTEKQATSLEETAANMQELTSTVRHNAENALEANKLAGEASKIAGRGVEVVNQVVATMEDINHSSRKIGDIISVIDDIAFQTNILALNAAVEAARAGDQGKGFAVVATEVRNLAQRAATAAGEVKNLINDSVAKVNSGSKLVTQAGETMGEIVVSIHGVTTMMSEITAASSEQSRGIEQVNKAVGEMDEVTQQNAALVEESAAAAEALEEQARKLSVSVSHFNVNYEKNSTSTNQNVQPKMVTKSSTKPVSVSQLSHDDWEEF